MPGRPQGNRQPVPGIERLTNVAMDAFEDEYQSWDIVSGRGRPIVSTRDPVRVIKRPRLRDSVGPAAISAVDMQMSYFEMEQRQAAGFIMRRAMQAAVEAATWAAQR